MSKFFTTKFAGVWTNIGVASDMHYQRIATSELCTAFCTYVRLVVFIMHYRMVSQMMLCFETKKKSKISRKCMKKLFSSRMERIETYLLTKTWNITIFRSAHICMVSLWRECWPSDLWDSPLIEISSRIVHKYGQIYL